MHILLVEDDPNILDMYKSTLEQNGYSVYTASDGEMAVKQALDKRPDLLLLDLGIPKLNGLQVMEKVREDEWGKKVPIIILTNFNPDDKILNAVVKGNPTYYLIKSDVTPEGIVLKIQEVFKENKNPAA